MKIIARGNKVTLHGDDDSISIANRVFGEMLLTINQKGYLSENDVRTLIHIEKGDIDKKEDISPNTVILYTKTGAIKPRTPNQEEYYKSTLTNDIVFAIGPAGTGKTYLAVAIAIAAFKNHEVQRIILTRPAVEAGEKLGFLPGDLKEKVDPYLAPLYDALYEMLPTEKLRSLIDQKIIEVIPLAYMRGRTLNNAYVILDEAQNTTSMQMKMFLTRLGANSKAIITGDITQIDLPDSTTSGLLEAESILKGIEGIGFIYFDARDVVRHKLVKDIIKAYDTKNNKT
ncbi:MAG: PhoH family protein [Candidatus Neomarinimicrobiota bacterium]|nr:PhoH family protein [Candidatus Neomarinimicrobiota bacterium]RKY49340.1 MAG: PhoH family protein [Candidatus Neomarinimicrobiota bacterium]